jgi:hypothetical protein
VGGAGTVTREEITALAREAGFNLVKAREAERVMREYAAHPSSFTVPDSEQARSVADTIAALLDEMEALASIVNSPIVHEERNKLEGEIEALKAERDALARDAARFDWYFGRTDKIDFMQTYLTGMKDGWTPDQWRAAIDAAMKGASDE